MAKNTSRRKRHSRLPAKVASALTAIPTVNAQTPATTPLTVPTLSKNLTGFATSLGPGLISHIQTVYVPPRSTTFQSLGRLLLALVCPAITASDSLRRLLLFALEWYEHGWDGLSRARMTVGGSWAAHAIDIQHSGFRFRKSYYDGLQTYPTDTPEAKSRRMKEHVLRVDGQCFEVKIGTGDGENHAALEEGDRRKTHFAAWDDDICEISDIHKNFFSTSDDEIRMVTEYSAETVVNKIAPEVPLFVPATHAESASLYDPNLRELWLATSSGLGLADVAAFIQVLITFVPQVSISSGHAAPVVYDWILPYAILTLVALARKLAMRTPNVSIVVERKALVLSDRIPMRNIIIRALVGTIMTLLYLFTTKRSRWWALHPGYAYSSNKARMVSGVGLSNLANLIASVGYIIVAAAMYWKKYRLVRFIMGFRSVVCFIIGLMSVILVFAGSAICGIDTRSPLENQAPCAWLSLGTCSPQNITISIVWMNSTCRNEA